MSNQEILYRDSISIRKLPINFNQSDLGLFEHELQREIPSTALLNLEDVTVNADGLVFRGIKVLPEAFPSPASIDSWVGSRAYLKFLARNILFSHHKRRDRDAFWITDTWSKAYFHWMTDALPRLFTIRERIGDSTLLLPSKYQTEEFIVSSLKPFFLQNVEFIHKPILCKNLKMPTHTAPTGNYNESIMRGLRSFYIDYYQNAHSDRYGNKVYISRGKAQKRKIANEEECVVVLEEYGFKTVYFEDHSFEQQVKIALDAQYLISNHGAGLTNILFMNSGNSVFELRQKGDAHNNCYFALASALNLKYFYQLCDTEKADEDAHTANLIVDCKLLRKSIEQMLSK